MCSQETPSKCSPIFYRRLDMMQYQQIDKTGATPNTIFLTLEITPGMEIGQFLTWGLCMGTYEELGHYWAIKIFINKQQTAKLGVVLAWLTEHLLPKEEGSPMTSFSRRKHDKVQQVRSPQMHFCTSSTLLYLETTQNASNVKDWWLPAICSAFWHRKENYPKNILKHLMQPQYQHQ